MRRKDGPPTPPGDDLDRELELDLELEAEEQRERGLDPRSAAYAARRALGNRARIREEVHDMSAWARIEALWQDIRYGLRTFRRSPVFTLISITTLALGIGGCTAIFSIVYAVLLRPLPYADPGRLVLIWTELRARGVPDFPFPIPDVKDLRAETTTLEGVAGLFPPGPLAIDAGSAQPLQARALAATPNLLSVLGVRMEMGRAFTEADGAPAPARPPGPGSAPAPGQPPPPIIAVITHEFWQRAYGGDPGIVGKTIDFGGGGRAEIVGVVAPGFQLIFPPRTGVDPAVDIVTALRLNFDTAARNTGALRVVARLKPGVTLERAQAEAESFAAELRDRYPVKKTAGVHVRVVPMHADVVGEVRPSILALFGAVVFVLLIACANVANLLAVRSAARHRELVIRAAIGGTRGRLIRQLLTETLLLACTGALLGLGLAAAAMRLLLAMAPAKLPLMSSGSIGINGAVLAFTAAATLVTALVCGVIPALRASRPQVVDALRMTQGAASLRAGRALRNAVVVLEVALSFVLLIGSGLMLRSFVALLHADPGFDPNHVLTFTVQTRARTPEDRVVLFRQIEQRLRALPGVESVSAATPTPLDGGPQNIPWATEAGAADPSAFRQANFRYVRPRYFETLKTRVIDGRTFTEADEEPPQLKVVIDDMLAAIAFPGQSAVGRTLLIRNLRGGPDGPRNERVEVIGVVRHQRQESMTADGREALFLVDESVPGSGANRWLVRAKGPPEAIAPAVKAALAEVSPAATMIEVQPMTHYVDRSMAPMRFSVVLIAIFAGVAVVLALVGLYGVLSTVVRQRTAEIGVRMAFGASQGSILRLVVGEGLRLSVAGVAAGLVGAFAVTGLMRSMLIGVTPTDPVTFAGITVLFLGVSALAAWLPARRAARLAPTLALRDQ